jgi:hypothetical protein
MQQELQELFIAPGPSGNFSARKNGKLHQSADSLPAGHVNFYGDSIGYRSYHRRFF